MADLSIAYIIFNRPKHTRETFAAIRAQRPTKLFIIADGPRLSLPSDSERCQAVRQIVQDIDWPCEVHRNYAEQNMGLKKRISTGLNWVFSNVETAVILEDDCLPHPSFFRYCQQLLEHYRKDERIWCISGDNFQDGQWHGNGSYYFACSFKIKEKLWYKFEKKFLFRIFKFFR